MIEGIFPNWEVLDFLGKSTQAEGEHGFIRSCGSWVVKEQRKPAKSGAPLTT